MIGKRISVQRNVKCLSTFIARLVICLVFVGCSDSVPTPSSVRDCRVRWEAARPEAYRYQVGYATGSTHAEESWWRSLLEITVVNNKAVQVRRLDTGEVTHDAAENYPTIDGLFDILEEATASEEEVRVRYDSTDLFPDLIDVGNVAADYGYQYAVYDYAELDPDTIELLPEHSQVASNDLVSCAGLQRNWKQTRQLIERERTSRQGLICIWNVDTGELEMYGGGGDTGNDVEVSLAGNNFALFAPAASGRSGCQLFEATTGRMLREMSWDSDYTLRTNGCLSGDTTKYAIIETDERVSIRDDQNFVTAFATRGAQLRLIDTTSGKDLWKIPLEEEIHFTASLSFSPDGNLIAVARTPATKTTSSLANDVVDIYRVSDGSRIGTHAGRILAMTADGSQAALVVAVTVIERGTGDEVTVGHELVLWSIDSRTDQVLRKSDSPHASRFATFTPEGHLLADVSANYSSVRLNLETIDPRTSESLDDVTLPAVPWGDKWSISPTATTFARLGRTQTGEPLVEVHDIATETQRLRLDFSGAEPSGYPHVIGTATLIDADHLLTTHPEVIWNCPPGR